MAETTEPGPRPGGPATKKGDGWVSYPTIEVLVVSGQTLVRKGLSAVLDADPRIRVVADSDMASSAILLAKRLRPGVVLLDLDPLEGVADEAVSALSRWGATVIGWMEDPPDATGQRCAVLPKAISVPDLVDAIAGLGTGDACECGYAQ